jgi:hypothetical protein
MTSHEIPTDVRDLLREHIETYEQLEVLLRFAGTRDRTWTMPEMTAATGVPAEAVADALARLAASGVLTASDDGRRFSSSSDRAASIDALGDAFGRDRLGIMNLMTANALERVRTSALRAFTKAFVLGKTHDG